MGQKVHPYGFRLGFNKPWRSRWFAKQGYAKLLQEDLELKAALTERLKSAGVSSIEVDRPGNKLRVTIRTSRPGIIIGRKGAEIEKLKQDMAKKTKREVFIDIQEVHKPELDAQLVCESIALQLEKRVAFRRAMRKAVDSALRFGCKGIKVRVSRPSERRGNRAQRMVSAGAASAAHPARRYRLRFRRSAHHVRRDRHQGVVVQGRDSGSDQARAICCPSRSRGATRDRRDRGDRGDRGPRRGDRGRRSWRTAAIVAPVPAAPPAEPSGPAVQTPPSDLPRPAARPAAPILPPLMSPQQPSWKQEVRQETPPEPETKPAGEPKPEGSGENQ